MKRAEYCRIPLVKHAGTTVPYTIDASWLTRVKQVVDWAPWEYKGDFGIYEWHGLPSLTGAPEVKLIDALFRR